MERYVTSNQNRGKPTQNQNNEVRKIHLRFGDNDNRWMRYIIDCRI